jgi:predicted MPP superfamily phosphohydrolase
MFGSILILLATLMHVFIFWRAATIPFVKKRVPRRFLPAAGAMLWLVFFTGRVVGHGGSGAMAGILDLLSMTWMIVLFLMTVSLLAAEVITGFGHFAPTLAPRLRGVALMAGLALSVVAQVQGMRPPEVHTYDVTLAGLPLEMDGKVLIAMSDLHIGSQLGKTWLEARVAQVRDQRPDLVVLLGDLFEGHGMPQEDLLPTLRGLSAPLGVWAVPGNHEFHEDGNKALGLMKAAGIHVLFNQWSEVRPGLILAGIEDLTADHRANRMSDPIPKTLTGRPPGSTILLSHTPWDYEKAARAGVGLMLSGHTHGGQIWPFGYVVQIAYPLLAGRYEVGGMTVLVCRGTGTWGPRMRLWHTGEIIRVILHSTIKS